MNDTALIHLFSYGTLQQEGVQLLSFGRRLTGSKDAMPGFKKSMIEITDPDVIKTSGSKFHPVVVPSDNQADEVDGTVFAITANELAAADKYEVSEYKRIEVRLKSGINVWVYVKA